MKKYLEAGIIRANSIGLWYFIIHLPTTPAIDGHIFFLHFVFSLINGVELMKMAQSGLVHTGEQHFHCIMCKLAVWASLCWWTFHPRGLCHIYDFSMIKGALLHIGLHHQLLSHTCMLHAVCCVLHAARCVVSQRRIWCGSLAALSHSPLDTYTKWWFIVNVSPHVVPSASVQQRHQSCYDQHWVIYKRDWLCFCVGATDSTWSFK